MILDETVIELYELRPIEVEVVQHFLEHQTVPELPAKQRNGVLLSLVLKGILANEGDRLVAGPELERLKPVPFEEAAAEPPVALCSIREYCFRLARRGKNPAAQLGLVYSYLYGVPSERINYGLLGKIANTLGVNRAVLLLLEFAHNEYADPLTALTPIALGRAKEYRPDDAPSLAELDAERQRIDRSSFERRMQRWLLIGQTLEEVEEFIAERYNIGELTAAQSRAEQRQAAADFERWWRKGG